MAVAVKYVVVRNGDEKMSFANKKDADAYDKMLDLAESLTDWLEQGPVTLEDDVREELALWLAGQKDELGAILRTGKLPQADSVAAPVKKSTKTKAVETDAPDKAA